MVIQQPLQPAFVQAIAGLDPDRRRRLSRTASFAIAASIAAHVAVGFYIYEAKYAPPAPLVDTDQPITTTFIPNVIVPPKPPKPLPPVAHMLTPRAPTRPIPIGITTTPITPQILPNQIPVSDPPQIATYTPPPAVPEQAPRPSVITSPDWVSRPGPDEFSKYYPQRAVNLNASGAVMLTCAVSAAGQVQNCQVTSETPKDLGFGDAARKLSAYFKMKPQTRDGQPVDGASIHIPIRFTLG